MLIPLPKHREEKPEISIEFLYKDEEIQKVDEHGRRLFFNSEFSVTTGRNEELKLTCTNGKIKSPIRQIVDDQVFDVKEVNVALTKNNFAENIIKKTPPFNDFDFTEFIPLFEALFSIKK